MSERGMALYGLNGMTAPEGRVGGVGVVGGRRDVAIGDVRD